MENNLIKRVLNIFIISIGIALDIQFNHIYYSFTLLAALICIYYDEYKQGKNYSLLEYLCVFVIAPIVVKAILILFL